MKVVINGIRYVPEPLTMPCDFKGAFGRFVYLARKATNMTLEEAAADIGCSKSYVWELENGKSEPSLKLAAKIAKAYGVDLRQMAATLED